MFFFVIFLFKGDEMKRFILLFFMATLMITLSACSESAPVPFTITFDSAGGTQVAAIEVAQGENPSLPIPIKEGHSFAGWFTGVGPNDIQISNFSTINQDLKLYARWQINQYTMTFETEGGSLVNSITQDFGSTINLNSPEKEGHSFLKWNPSLPDTMPSSNMTFVAEWDINEYKILFLDFDNKVISSLNFQYGSDLTNTMKPKVPIRTGYIFSEWEGTLPNTMPGRDIEIYANYVVNPFSYIILNNEAIITGYSGTNKSIEIPNIIDGYDVTTISESAFAYKQLTNVIIPDSVTKIGNQAFAANILTSVIIPNSVTEIGDGAFAANLMSELYIPNSVITIGDYAFTSNFLTSVIIPESVKSIGDWAFSNNQLTEVTISNGVTSIGEGAFRNNQLTSIIIPDSVIIIGEGAFDGNQLHNEQSTFRSSVLDAFGIAYTVATIDEVFLINFELLEFDIDDEKTVVYREKDGGYIIMEILGSGAWGGPIYGFLVIEPDLVTINHVTILEHSETPSLGGQIGNPSYLANFKGVKFNPGINITSNPTGAENEVDAITGATVTSNGFEQILNDTYLKFIPFLQSLDD